MKMPVKTNSCMNFFDFSPSPRFDCDELEELTQDLTTDICTAPCEDIWKKFDDFLLTPPQSPPIRFDLVSDFVDNSDGEAALPHNVDVLHDCMWSGQCTEDSSKNSAGTCISSNARMCMKNRPDTPCTLLGTSPFNSYAFNEDLLSNDSYSADESRSSLTDETDEDDLTSSPYESPISSPSFVRKSLINDHSYGEVNRPAPKKIKKESQSLIYSSSCQKSESRARSSRVKCPKIGSRIIKIKANTQVPQPVTSPSKVKLVKSQNFNRNSSRSCLSSCSSNSQLITRRKIKIEPEKNCKFSSRKRSSSSSTVLLAQRSFSMRSAQNCHSTDPKNEKIPPLRRREHNDSERKRRDHLRNAFLDLKDQIPKLRSHDKRPARIIILNEATQYVHHLIDKQRYLEKTLNAEMDKREILLQELSRLQCKK